MRRSWNLTGDSRNEHSRGARTDPARAGTGKDTAGTGTGLAFAALAVKTFENAHIHLRRLHGRTRVGIHAEHELYNSTVHVSNFFFCQNV